MSLRKNFDQIIKVPNGLWFNEIPLFKQIPNKSIIYKTIPGLGATFSEVIALRHSIIVLPHVSIIKNKHAKYKDLYKTFAVYGDSQTTKTKDILEYLCSDVAHKKFLTTPKGLDKIKNAFSQLGKLGMLHELYRDYFLLVDECHKWVKDTGYRNDMIPTMDDFFQFLNKAMVSATVIPMSDPRLELQGFKHIKLEPVFSIKDDEKNFRGDRGPFHPYKRDIKILNVNSITTG